MYLYPKWIRAWHLINAAMFLILIVTGISMQYTDKENAAYVVGFAKAVKWHNFGAIMLTANYVFFILGNAVTKNIRYYKIKRENGYKHDKFLLPYDLEIIGEWLIQINSIKYDKTFTPIRKFGTELSSNVKSFR